MQQQLALSLSDLLDRRLARLAWRQPPSSCISLSHASSTACSLETVLWMQ